MRSINLLVILQWLSLYVNRGTFNFHSVTEKTAMRYWTLSFHWQQKKCVKWQPIDIPFIHIKHTQALGSIKSPCDPAPVLVRGVGEELHHSPTRRQPSGPTEPLDTGQSLHSVTPQNNHRSFQISTENFSRAQRALFSPRPQTSRPSEGTGHVPPRPPLPPQTAFQPQITMHRLKELAF